MPTEPQDEDWAARRLSAEAERFDFDRAAFRARVMSQVHGSIGSEDTPAAAAASRGRRLVGRSRFTRACVTDRSPRTVRSDPRPRSVPAMLAAAAIVAIAVIGSVTPGMRAWGGDRLGVSRTAGNVPSSDAPAPTHTTSLGAHPPSLFAPTPATTSPRTGSGPKATMPSSFRWSSGEPLISAKPDADHPVTGIKDASVVYYQGKWHVFASSMGGSAPTLVYLSFADWDDAGSATQYYLDQSGIGVGYRAAPQVFYFAPQKLWYLVYQTGNASYSTNPDLSDPHGWSAPKDFYPGGMPDLIRRNVGGGYWVDMWVICDDTDCYLFSSDQQGHLYRSRTRLADFPNGMGQPVIALQDPNRFNLLNSTNVYKVAGVDQYLLVVEAADSDGVSYLRSWTATSPGGAWTPLAVTESAPFAHATDVAFTGKAWTKGISHGELIRDGHDQTLTITPCRLRYLYHGETLQLGLLTQTNSTCS